MKKKSEKKNKNKKTTSSSQILFLYLFRLRRGALPDVLDRAQAKANGGFDTRSGLGFNIFDAEIIVGMVDIRLENIDAQRA